MIRGYIAQSTDGFVADRDGSVAFLTPFNDVDYGYDAFLGEIGTVVMGRATYDQILSFDVGWPYPDQRGIVVTSRPLDTRLGEVSAWSGPLPDLAAKLNAAGGGGDAWIVGGPRLQTAFIEAGLIDRLQLFVMPVLLGGGVPLFRSEGAPKSLALQDVRRFDKGVVGLGYRLP
ncbi:dihydrofolate reductase family protein [Oceanomicrobium pacificus]|uniref:Dihydrofolate reductase n=1 Tax=Oceanomicrobium pacificus TaxID=2692916 RepID=A0A6B0TVI6_9RHOB|nr:dihydrofolate reductase family protein [Oceanomicrobium pacificus]MXU65785.1 dihydrofolate reductase [Oceanomicrobium pacificus]